MLRHFEPSDASMVQELAGHEEVARTTVSIPDPFPDGAAQAWIDRSRLAAENGEIYSFAMIKKEDESLIGCVSLRIAKAHNHSELAYWVGRPYWGQGFATEAAIKIVQFGFDDLRLIRIHAAAMAKNPASYKVMTKIGMKYEGTFPRHVFKSRIYEELVYYGLFKTDS